MSPLTDTASEMLYPVMPIYLQTIGFSIVLIGILEGVAEATAGLSKGYFGRLSDASDRRTPFVQIGYAFSAVSKVSFFSFLHYWKISPKAYQKLVVGLLIFTLFNSSDVFLILKGHL